MNRTFSLVAGCFCCTQKQSYLSFHLFLMEITIRNKWIQTVKREEGLNFIIRKGSTYVCRRLFKHEDIIEGCTVSHLKKMVLFHAFFLGTIFLHC